MSFSYAPRGWALFDGQLLPINQNQALFSLLGTTFGGDGRVNFALPDLRGRVPVHMGNGRTLGERGGEQTHTLALAEVPEHVHTAMSSTQAANSPAPTSDTFAASGGNQFYGPPTNLTALQAGDGESTFALPDLRGRLPLHQGNGFALGETGGVEDVTLNVNQLPAHTHAFLGSTQLASASAPSNSVVAQDNLVGADLYIEDQPTVSMAANSITPVGGSQPHTNFQPYMCVNYILSLFGIFPSPT